MKKNQLKQRKQKLRKKKKSVEQEQADLLMNAFCGSLIENHYNDDDWCIEHFISCIEGQEEYMKESQEEYKKEKHAKEVYKAELFKTLDKKGFSVEYLIHPSEYVREWAKGKV